MPDSCSSSWPRGQDTCPAVKSAAALALAEMAPQSLNSLLSDGYVFKELVLATVQIRLGDDGAEYCNKAPFSRGESARKTSIGC